MINIEKLKSAQRALYYHEGSCFDYHYVLELIIEVLTELGAEEDTPVDNVCPVCHKVIINDAHGGLHPSPGDHDPGEHVLATYGMREHGYTCGWCDWGRPDQPRSKIDYDRHVQETGHVGEKK
jgi:hypothetical protein